MFWRRPYTDASVIRRRIQKAIHRVSWAYLFLLLVLWEYLRLRGDRSWLGTVVLFGPVWVAVAPAVVLIALALFLHRRSLFVLGLALVIALFPIMGLCVPWRTTFHHAGGGQRLRVLTCNVNWESRNEAALAGQIESAQPDVVLLQEWFADRPPPSFVREGWHWRRDGELLVASRYPIESAQDLTEPQWAPWGGAVARYDIATPDRTVHVFNIHLASPHNMFRDIIDGKPTGGHELEVHLDVRQDQSRKISKWAGQYGGGVIIAGDFNSIAEGNIFRHAWRPWNDAFTHAGWGLGHTYYAEGAAVRIDHILAGRDWFVEDCWVGANVGSPHRPVIADLEWVGGN